MTPGIDSLCKKHIDWLQGRRVGLVGHPASVNACGTPSAEWLRKHKIQLAALFGAEHGYYGLGGAGERVEARKHAAWKIPIHSLYGTTRKPTPKMLKGIDTIVFDLQDLGARCYTYVSTLRYILEAAAENKKEVIVADRPSPLAGTVDGPMLKPAFSSFVALIPAPVVYGMTPGETALWLKDKLRLRVDLRIAKMEQYRRKTYKPSDRRWIPPSPAIKSWKCGLCFPLTVFFEAIPAVDHGRGTATPFQLFGAPWIDAEKTSRALNRLAQAGLRFSPKTYRAMIGLYKGKRVQGVRIEVTDPATFRPVAAAVAVIHHLQETYGIERLWQAEGTREEFFDKLMGTDTVRKALQKGASPTAIVRAWRPGISAFTDARRKHLLYPV